LNLKENTVTQGTLVPRELTRQSLWVAIAAGIGMFVGPTPMVSAVASLFMVPLTREFSLSRTAISAIYLVQPITVALFSAYAGRLIDRYGVRRVLLPAVVLFALGNVWMGLVHSLWQLMLGYVFIGLCISVHCYSSYTKVLSEWFDRNRGLVMGICITFGSGLGGVLIPQIVRPWVETNGWRSAFFGIAVLIVVVGLPPLYAFLREPRPGEIVRPTSTGTAAVDVKAEGLTRSEALHTRTFWLIAVAIFLAPMTIVGTLAHAFPLITERGNSAAAATNALSSLYIGGMIGYFTSGILLDRVHTPRIVLPYFGAALCGMWLLHSTTDAGWLVPAAILMGLGQGSEMSIAAYFTSRYFGLKAYGAIYGTFYSIANTGIAAGIFSMGFVHDLANGYRPMRYVFLVNLILVLLLFASLGPYRYARRQLAVR
jgi:MFS family permease